jgi:hypothetical protein
MDPAAPAMRLTPSPLRRWIGVGMLAALGGLLLWLALSSSAMAPGWRAVLGAIGLGAAWGAERMWRATGLSVELTAAGLSDSNGRVIAPLAAIRSIDRGAFAFKPSNGFLVRLNAPQPRAWAPGLWWRIGRSVGVGGVTNRDEAKLMAEYLAAMLAGRGGGSG